MLAIKKSETNTTNCAVNVLPCRIQHNGPVNASTRLWTPQESSDGKSHTAYFRGRKLKGRVVELPDGYIGMFDLSSISSHFSACYYPFFPTSLLHRFTTYSCSLHRKQGRNKRQAGLISAICNRFHTPQNLHHPSSSSSSLHSHSHNIKSRRPTRRRTRLLHNTRNKTSQPTSNVQQNCSLWT
jgi:hypothetical protein